jgi:hypothetical protein
MPAVLACPACRTQPMSRRGDPLCPVCAQQARETVPWPLWLGLTIICHSLTAIYAAKLYHWNSRSR